MNTEVDEEEAEEEGDDMAARNGEPRSFGGIGPSILSGPLIGVPCLLAVGPAAVVGRVIVVG